MAGCYMGPSGSDATAIQEDKEETAAPKLVRLDLPQVAAPYVVVLGNVPPLKAGALEDHEQLNNKVMYWL
ncbi:hypothetical protein NDU88_002830 [Pleurodeles waltl]|uniref:Uncharacterized protein n=1 Tax=Pleurodeles waltl TaxID=8319 RepID=A0AAV7VFQ2_PLEWA|nr:hypothetical protein NDU88_002830 [Pleurodeles waltl]